MNWSSEGRGRRVRFGGGREEITDAKVRLDFGIKRKELYIDYFELGTCGILRMD